MGCLEVRKTLSPSAGAEAWAGVAGGGGLGGGGAAEYNRAIVAVQYYDYLRRTAEEDGYEAWLRVINEDPNNIRIMVNGFMNSTEYRLRFDQP